MSVEILRAEWVIAVWRARAAAHVASSIKNLLFFGVALVRVVTAGAKVMRRPVVYEHAGVKLEGVLVYDDAKISVAKPGAGVLVIPKWWGLNNDAKGRAVQLAELGFVAFAVDLYGAGVIAGGVERAGEPAGQFYGKPLMAERARAGLDQLLATKLVDPARVAAIGDCFGGAVRQALAYIGAPWAGIVSFHGLLIPAAAESAKANRANFLICLGAVDPFIKPEELAAFTKSMDGGKFDYQLISYAGAIHAFTNPKADEVAKATGLVGGSATTRRPACARGRTCGRFSLKF